MDAIGLVKTLLQIKDNEWDGVIKAHILLISQKILNYCNVAKLPDELKMVVASLVVEHMRKDVEDFKGVTSISMGDTSTKYNTAPVSDNVLTDVRSQLNRFRRLP